MTREEAIAACVARGWRRPECEELVEASMVGGEFCDGTLVITADGRRCVSSTSRARREAVRLEQPQPQQPAPSSPPWLVPLALSTGFRLLWALSDMWDTPR